MIKSEQYAEIWRQEGVSDDVISRAVRRYDELPLEVVRAVAIDDVWAGVWPILIKYTDEDIADHDHEFRLKQLGFPISTNLETNADLLVGQTKRAVRNILTLPIILGTGIFGSLGGFIWWELTK